MKTKRLLFCLVMLPVIIFAQPGDATISVIDNYADMGWQSYVMDNGIISMSTVPAIGARVMTYNLGDHASIYTDPSLYGKTFNPATYNGWPNLGGFKNWPAPQSVWNWTPPPYLDFGAYEPTVVAETEDSVSLYVKGQVEQKKTPDLSFDRTATIYKGSSRVRMEQVLINHSSKDVEWGIWDITQSLGQHGNERDYENFWVYFPINPNSKHGSDGVWTQRNSKSWVGEVAPGIYGCQFVPGSQKIFADVHKGWICYVDEKEGVAYAKTFEVFPGEPYPDDETNVAVWMDSKYLEVEVMGPIRDIPANGGSTTFVMDWWTAKVNGPILNVNNVGAIKYMLDYKNGAFTANYGIFYQGTAKLAFKDDAGAIISYGQKYSVSPNENFVLNETIEIPANAKSVEFQVFDYNGDLVGALENISIDDATSIALKNQPDAFELGQNFPNPFNPVTTIPFSLEKAGHVKLEIFDLNGNKVETLANGVHQIGPHQISWSAENIPSGQYFYRLQMGNQTQIKKLVILK